MIFLWLIALIVTLEVCAHIFMSCVGCPPRSGTSSTSTSTSSTSTSSSSTSTSTSSTSTSSTSSSTSTSSTSTSTSSTSTSTSTSSSSTSAPPCNHWTIGGSGSGTGSASQTLPANSCAGSVSVSLTGQQGTPGGVIITVLVNGTPIAGPSACLTSGSYGPITVPAQTLSATLLVSITGGCGGGPAQGWTVSGSG